MLVPVEVQSLGLDKKSKTPGAVLEEREGPRTLPIWIAVPPRRRRSPSPWDPARRARPAKHLAKQALEPPRTHDLLASVIAGFGGSVEEVAILRAEGAAPPDRLALLAVVAGEEHDLRGAGAEARRRGHPGGRAPLRRDRAGGSHAPQHPRGLRPAARGAAFAARPAFGDGRPSGLDMTARCSETNRRSRSNTRSRRSGGGS